MAKDNLLQFILSFKNDTDKAINGADKNIKQLARSTNELDAAQSSASAGMGKMLGSVMGMAGGLLAGLSAVNLIKDAWQQSLAVIEKYAKLSDNAMALGIGVEALQALRIEGQRTMMSVEELDGALTTMSGNIAKGAVGLGRMGKALDSVNVELKEQLVAAPNVAAQLDILAKAVNGMTDYTEQEIIALGLFGSAGYDMLDILKEMDGGVKALTASHRELGLIVEGDTVQAIAAMRLEMVEYQQRGDLAAERLALVWAPGVADLTERFANLAENINLVFENSQPVGERSIGALNRQLAFNVQETQEIAEEWASIREDQNFVADARRDYLRKRSGELVMDNIALRAEIEARNTEAAAREESENRARASNVALQNLEQQIPQIRIALGDLSAAEKELAETRDKLQLLGAFTDDAQRDTWFNNELTKLRQSTDAYKLNEAAVKSRFDAEREAERVRDERNKMEAEYAKLMTTSGDKSFELAELTKKLGQWQEAGVLQAEDYAAAFERGRDKILGITTTTERYMDLLTNTSPIAKAKEALNQLYEDRDAGLINDLAVYAQSVALLQANVDEAVRSEANSVLSQLGSSERYAAAESDARASNAVLLAQFEQHLKDGTVKYADEIGVRNAIALKLDADLNQLKLDQAAERASLDQSIGFGDANNPALEGTLQQELARIQIDEDTKRALLLSKFDTFKGDYQAYQDRLTEIGIEGARQRREAEAANASMLLSQAEAAGNDVTGILKDTLGENSAIYKLSFAATKAFAIAQSIVSIQAALASAAASAPFPLNLGVIATVAAQTASIVSTIMSTSLALKDGGRVRGPGGPRGDKIPAMLSDGEFVVNAAATARNLALLEALNGGRRVRNPDNAADRDLALMEAMQGGRRFAEGGLATLATAPAARMPGGGGTVALTVNNTFHIGDTAGRTPDQRRELVAMIDEQSRASARAAIQEEMRANGMLARLRG
jgi:hypothetical protein